VNTYANTASGDESDLSAAACLVFAARSTCKLAPSIEQEFGLVLACWRQTEKSGKPRIVPLVFSQSIENYKRMAIVLPEAKEWTAYRQIDQLFDELAVPLFSRKGNLPRLLLIAILDYAESHQSTRFAALMRELPRGRADFFNLALGHVSKSYLLWTYMGMTITNDASTAAPSTAAPSTSTTSTTSSQPLLQQLSALNDDELATIAATIAGIRQQRQQNVATVSVLTPATVRLNTTTASSIPSTAATLASSDIENRSDNGSDFELPTPMTHNKASRRLSFLTSMTANGSPALSLSPITLGDCGSSFNVTTINYDDVDD